MDSGDFRFLVWSYILISSVCSWAGLLALCHWEVSSPSFLPQKACLTHSQWYLPWASPTGKRHLKILVLQVCMTMCICVFSCIEPCVYAPWPSLWKPLHEDAFVTCTWNGFKIFFAVRLFFVILPVYEDVLLLPGNRRVAAGFTSSVRGGAVSSFLRILKTWAVIYHTGLFWL